MTDKTVLITGSSRGIGRAAALYLAKLGYNIVLHCKSSIKAAEDALLEIINMGRQCRILQFDINDRKRCFDILTNDVQQSGAYYGLVLNAGIVSDTPFPALTDAQWDDVINTNLNGFYNVVKPVLMDMIATRKPGRIVALSSVSGIIGNRGQVNYSASKAAIIGAVKALALELARHKITVNCVAPGLIETDMTKDVGEDFIKSVIPMRRMGKPEEAASLIAYLLSEDAQYITRQVISVNGGLC
ncbi:MAG: 3-oxoacyl-ACP reductase FabG [Deferribacteraceae bacterium]|jgi:3-oxoacyl-[acyl-carrier protein] reductase|nr:3-oxoacyl-ACP reductase FabG [Deferribacteraceae bacterium]